MSLARSLLSRSPAKMTLAGAGNPWSGTGTVGTNNNIRFYPFTSGNGGWFNSLNFNVKSSGSVDLGIYESRSWTNLEPYRLVTSTGSNVWSTGDQSFATNFCLKAGRIYWVACGYHNAGFQIGSPSTLSGLQTEVHGAFSLAALTGTQAHTWEMVGCYTNALPATFPNGFSIIGQTGVGMAFPIALRGN